MILENNVRWYAEDGALTKTFCEMDSAEVEALDGEKCCACDEAKYSVSYKINFICLTRDQFRAPNVSPINFISRFIIGSIYWRETLS